MSTGQMRVRLIAILLLAVMMYGNNCSRFSTIDGDQTDLASTDSSSSTDTPNTQQDATGGKSLLNFEQVYSSMLNLTSQATPTSAQKQAFSAVSGPLSDNSDLTSYSAPVLLGMNTLAGEVCNGLITKEAALTADQRKFFAQIDFTKAVGLVSENTFINVSSTMSQIFYSRALKPAESALLTAYYRDFIAAVPANEKTQNKHTKSLILGTCAALLSSFDAMTF